ncbi:MAG: hypothetical protein ABJB86_13745 [Bacteroidota bacterium]
MPRIQLLLLICIFSFCNYKLHAQPFYFRQYQVENGSPTPRLIAAYSKKAIYVVWHKMESTVLTDIILNCLIRLKMSALHIILFRTSNGKEGLAIPSKESVQLVVSDIVMPENLSIQYSSSPYKPILCINIF